MADKVDFGPRLGADPELFVIARKGGEFAKNTIVPVCGKVGGTKNNPVVVPKAALADFMKMDSSSKGDFAYQEDNVMFEFNIPGLSNSDYFHHTIQGYLSYLENSILAPRGLMLAWINKYKFPEKFLTHPMAHIIGCSPDFDAYRPKHNQVRKPFEITDLGNQRFCGGHLHVQYNTNNVPREIFARYMDLVVGLPFLSLDKQGDRRKFYGKAGIYRPKDYGIEYRTPSNFWLDPKIREKQVCSYLAHNIFSLANSANTEPSGLSETYRKVPWPDVEKAINDEDTKLSDEIVRHIAMRVLPFGMYSYHAGQFRSHY